MIAQLITLYGNKLACFKPMTDDDGVDLIVKVKGGRDIVCLQVKSRFEGKRGGVFTATARRLPSDSGPLIDALAYVFCAFDNKKGDLWDYLWLVPAREFVSKANPLRGGRLGFVAGRGRKSGKWDEYLIHKRELAQTLQRLLDQMKKHNSPRSASHLPSSNARALDHS